MKDENYEPGLVMHTNGWPTPFDTPSGSYFYHGENNEAYVGYVIPLDYKNPHLSPFDEFQKWKTHPSIKKYLEGGERLSYGARALIKGGLFMAITSIGYYLQKRIIMDERADFFEGILLYILFIVAATLARNIDIRSTFSFVEKVKVRTFRFYTINQN